MDELTLRLDELQAQGRYRRLRMVSGPQGPRVVLDGTPVLLLAADNFLGLADHPKVREATADAAMRWGVGAGASRLVSGAMTIHRRLEERLAGFVRQESALLFGSGTLAAHGLLQALRPHTSVIAVDLRSNAALLDACRSTGLPVVTFAGDPEPLAARLREASGAGRPLIASDAVLSADGARADLHAVAALARRVGARSLIGESCALGCIGSTGRGGVAEAGLEGAIDIVYGSLGKTLGSYGGFVAGSATLTRFLVNQARTLTCSTAPAPPAIAGAFAALELLEGQPERVARLQANGAVLHGALADEGVRLPTTPAHITAIDAGDAVAASTLSERLLERRVFAQAVRRPGGDDRALLRVSVSAAHTPQELRRAAGAIADAARELGLPIASGPVQPAMTHHDDSLGEWSAAPIRATDRRGTAVAGTGGGGAGGVFDVEAVDPSLLRARRATPAPLRD